MLVVVVLVVSGGGVVGAPVVELVLVVVVVVVVLVVVVQLLATLTVTVLGIVRQSKNAENPGGVVILVNVPPVSGSKSHDCQTV